MDEPYDGLIRVWYVHTPPSRPALMGWLRGQSAPRGATLPPGAGRGSAVRGAGASGSAVVGPCASTGSRSPAATQPLAPSDGSRTLRQAPSSACRSSPITSSVAPSPTALRVAAPRPGSARRLAPHPSVLTTRTCSAGAGSSLAVSAVGAVGTASAAA